MSFEQMAIDADQGMVVYAANRGDIDPLRPFTDAEIATFKLNVL